MRVFLDEIVKDLPCEIARTPTRKKQIEDGILLEARHGWVDRDSEKMIPFPYFRRLIEP